MQSYSKIRSFSLILSNMRVTESLIGLHERYLYWSTVYYIELQTDAQIKYLFGAAVEIRIRLRVYSLDKLIKIIKLLEILTLNTFNKIIKASKIIFKFT